MEASVTRLERRDNLAVLWMEHGKVNAIDIELLAALGERLDELEDSHARALILTASGPTFSAGVDLWRVLEGGAEYLLEFVPVLQRSLSRLFGFPKPVVAAVNGHAIAGGCVLACACDHRVMASDSGRIGVPELRVGVPFPGIALEIIRAAAPPPLFNRLVYGGETFAPEEATKLGLIEETATAEALLDRAAHTAQRLAVIPAETFAVTKRQLRGPILERADRHARETDELVTRIWSSDEVMAAIRAHMERTVGRRNPQPSRPPGSRSE